MGAILLKCSLSSICLSYFLDLYSSELQREIWGDSLIKYLTMGATTD